MNFLTIFYFILGFVFIIQGADWFVKAAVSISEKFGIPKIIIGSTIVSFATTAPELSVSATATYVGHTGIAVGNVLGSVICNIGLIFGAIIIIKSVPINIESFLNRALFMLVSGATVVVLSIDGKLTWHEGILLILIFIGFLYYNYRLQASIFKKSKKLNSNTKERQDIFKLIKTRFHEISKDILLFIVGAGGVIIGSRLLVDSGVKIAQWLGIPELIIGLTLFALGTSLPELITAITATMKGHQEISLGNILGANTMNLTFVLGFCSFINPLEINAQLFEYDFIVMIGLMILLLIFGTTRNLFSKKEGLALLGIYIAYVIGLFVLYG